MENDGEVNFVQYVQPSPLVCISCMVIGAVAGFIVGCFANFVTGIL